MFVPGVPGRRDVRPLLRGPVLVVARGEQRVRPVQQVRVGVDVHAGHIGQWPPGPLGQLDRLPLVVQEHVGAVGVVRPVQADGERAVVVVAHPAGPVVQVVAAPGVVGLPGLHAVLDHDLAGRAGRPDGHRHEPLGAVLRVQPEQIGTLRPVVGGHGQGWAPPGLHRVGRPDQLRLALPVPLHRGRLPDQPRLVTLVPAHPEGTHPERAGRGGHVQRDRLARQHAGLPGIAGDGVRGAQVPDVPVRVARTVVLVDRAFRGGARPRPLLVARAAAPADGPGGRVARRRGHGRGGGGDPEERPPRKVRVPRGQPHAIYHEPAPAGRPVAGPIRIGRMTFLDHSHTRQECGQTGRPRLREPHQVP